ncbi:MAG: YfhO family protein [Candidatus Levybacteria bacterium]|nr:YfhO family protein [Candidatus Levybacteria bacterium]
MTRSNFMDGTNSPGNVFNTIWFDGALEKQKNKIIFKNNSGQVKTQLLTSTRYKFDIFLKESAEAVVNTAYFPGWEVFVDGKKIKIGYNNDGLITFPILQGKHSILVTFQDIGVRNLAKIVSSISLLWLIIREQYLFSGRFLTFFIKSKHEDRN